MLPSHADVKTASILTVGDLPAGDGYRMVGIPDGMGAVNINRRFFKLMMNHELGATTGIAEDGQIAELQVHNTLLFEGVNNTLKLLGSRLRLSSVLSIEPIGDRSAIRKAQQKTGLLETTPRYSSNGFGDLRFLVHNCS